LWWTQKVGQKIGFAWGVPGSDEAADLYFFAHWALNFVLILQIHYILNVKFVLFHDTTNMAPFEQLSA